ncbi:MAG: redoxin domain-containing protein [Gemmataceae bacterium]|nr:redoxin domain-containing protein [Gemmataceae bacterium]
MRTRILSLIALACSLGATHAGDTRVGPALLKPAEAGVGRQVADLAFTDIEGKPGRLSDFRGSKFLVIAQTSTTCPLCLKYAPTLAGLEKEFASRGVAFLFVNCVPPDRVEDMKKAVATHQWKGRYVHDKDEKLAAGLRATSTTEVYVLDPTRTVLYRGAVDDQYGLGYSKEAPTRRYLADALGALLADRDVAVAATAAPGCALEPERETTSPSSITYHGRIARIVQNHCQTCHRDGGVAPFALGTYAEVSGHAAMIRKVVERGSMPPWFAKSPEGPHATWANEPTLSAEEKADLLAWIGGGKPEGDPADAPRPRTYPKDWVIGTPDVVLQIPKPIAVKATGTMPYQMETVTTSFDEDKWVQALEVQPTAREVVHHVLVFVGPPGARRFAGENDERAGFFACYVPGTSSLIYPEGFAKKLPKGASLRFQIHYTPNGTATQDQTRLALKFAKSPPKHQVHVTGIPNVRIRIPAGAAAHAESASIRLPSDVRVMAFMPHMHLRGAACKYEATTPDGKTQTLLDIPKYDFNWQITCRYAEPVPLPKGTTIKFTGVFDNSAANPANPDPNKTVRWGPQTYDEMLLGYVEYYHEREEAEKTAGDDDPAVRLFKRVDTNGDGRISREEYDAEIAGSPRLKDNPAAAKALFDRLDADKDGTISLAELRERGQFLFSREKP